MHVCVVMNEWSEVNVQKDSTCVMLAAAYQRGWQTSTTVTSRIFLRDGVVWASGNEVVVTGDGERSVDLLDSFCRPLTDFDAVFLRQDPPFDMKYIYLTYLLDRVHAAGTPVFNHPTAVRNWNEKISITRFPSCSPRTLVATDLNEIRFFIDMVGEAVMKPLGLMGGQHVFRVNAQCTDLDEKWTVVTDHGRLPAMVQVFVPEIELGDKRIILIGGKPIGYALARVPKAGSFLGNLAQGAVGRVQPLSERDEWICQRVGSTLVAAGLDFVGLDVIGDYLTEINVTSPTGLCELNRDTDLDLGNDWMIWVERAILSAVSVT